MDSSKGDLFVFANSEGILKDMKGYIKSDRVNEDILEKMYSELAERWVGAVNYIETEQLDFRIAHDYAEVEKELALIENRIELNEQGIQLPTDFAGEHYDNELFTEYLEEDFQELKDYMTEDTPV